MDLFFIHVEVLLSGESGVFDSYRSNGGGRNLLDSVSGESSVDVGTEFNVIEHILLVWGPVLGRKAIILWLGQVEVEH